MINKNKLWFLTLFSLILVLSLYYVTMPDVEISKEVVNVQENISESINESSILVALRVEKEEEVLDQLESLKEVLTDKEKTMDEKNEAFSKIKELNMEKGEEEQLEKILKEEFKCDFFVKVRSDKIKVVVNSDEKTLEFVNKIMHKVQENYNSKVYITVEFK